MGLLEDAYEATNREDDERILIAALSSMDLRTDIRETVLTVDASVFYNQIHGTIWTAARTLAADDRLMLFDNFKPLLGAAAQRKLQELYGRPVRLVELTTAVDLVVGAAKRRRLVDGLKQIAAVTTTSDQYDQALASAHEVIAGMDEQAIAAEATSIGQALDAFWDDVKNPKARAEVFATPWPKLDESYFNGGLRRQELSLWMAPTKGGKSIALLQLADKWALEGRKLAIFSLEMSSATVINRMLSAAGQVKIRDVANRNIDVGSKIVLEQLTETLQHQDVQIFDSSEMTMNDIRQQCNVLKRTQGLDGVFIDYVQIVQPGPEESRERQVNRIVWQMKMLSKALDCHVATASQQTEQEGRPNKSSTRESKAILHHVDLALALHHERDSMGQSTGMVDVVVVANRNGPEGAVSMSWNPHISAISE